LSTDRESFQLAPILASIPASHCLQHHTVNDRKLDMGRIRVLPYSQGWEWSNNHSFGRQLLNYKPFSIAVSQERRWQG